MSLLTVTNLTAVPFQCLDFFAANIHLGVVFVADIETATLVVIFQLLEEVVPDLDPCGVVELVVAERKMDARHECLVEVADAVGS